LPLQPIKGYSFEITQPSKSRQIHLKWSQLGIVSSYLDNDVVRISGFGDIAGLDTTIDEKRMDYMKEIAAQFYG
jgi:hypothetical protein